MKKLSSLALALVLALVLSVWAPVAAIAEGGVEQDTMTEEFEVATQGSNQGGKTGGSSSTSAGGRSPLAKTGDDTSMLLPACLAGAALVAFAVGKAVRK